MLKFLLSNEAIRVLGVLMEKELTTPEYYPLSVNALKNGCNQTTNRDPLVSYDDETVQAALDGLIQQNLVWDSPLGRVAKYGQNLSKQLNLVPREAVVLSLLFLRGPQTVGELRGRSGRAYAFSDLNEVQEVLTNLTEWGHAEQLPRQAGRKEPRYRHLFAENPGEAEVSILERHAAPSETTGHALEKITQLEIELKTLRTEFEDLKQAFQEFKTQF